MCVCARENTVRLGFRPWASQQGSPHPGLGQLFPRFPSSATPPRESPSAPSLTFPPLAKYAELFKQTESPALHILLSEECSRYIFLVYDSKSCKTTKEKKSKYLWLFKLLSCPGIWEGLDEVLVRTPSQIRFLAIFNITTNLHFLV